MSKLASPRGAVRERVLQAALELFAEHGVSGTSLQMIADRVGVAKASVYYQFHTKEDIVLTLISPVFDDIARLVKIADAVSFVEARRDVAISGWPRTVCGCPRIEHAPHQARDTNGLSRLGDHVS